MTGGSLVLKQSLHRCVRLERRSEGPVIVKRFEQRGPLGRALDAGRARREYEVLTHLAKASVSVPRALSLTRRGRAYEVEIEWIDGARSLAELCRAGAPLSVELARRLGELLAGLHSAGVDHPDLHAGNVLITEACRVVAVDFDKARIVKRVGDEQVSRDLVSLCAGLREATLPRWRAVALRAWWKALDLGLRDRLAPPRAFEVEQLARARRLRVVQDRERRWTRAGSAVMALASGRGFARAGADPALIARALAGETLPSSTIRVSGSRRQVLALWRSMARLEEHAVPAPRCWLLSDESPACAWFERELPRKPSSPRGRGRWIGALIDRALWCPGLAEEDLDDSGLRLPRVLARLSMSEARERLAPWLAGLSPDARREFLRGLAESWRGPLRECRELVLQLHA
ncbi:MAG TPA: lipopolysaccharide kinase InaA family protein [Planctomycetota bacterium]|nr:lipopolysaccharide kinase InaA family protein [Planctomycetota bacterium]